MKGKGIAVLILLALIACGVGGAIMSARLENVAIYAIDANYTYQQQPVAVLERQLASVQANSPSNAPNFPWMVVLMGVGAVVLLAATYYKEITIARTAYLKARGKTARPAAAPIRTLTPVRPLNPYGFTPATPPPALPAPSRDDEEGDYERW